MKNKNSYKKNQKKIKKNKFNKQISLLIGRKMRSSKTNSLKEPYNYYLSSPRLKKL